MKKSLRLCCRSLAVVLLLVAGRFSAQAQVGVGTTSPDSKAALHIESTANDKGVLIPRLTQTQRRAILNPPQGLMVFQTGTATVSTDSVGFWYATGVAGTGGVGKWLYLPDKTAVGDNLGNHTATANLNLADKLLVGGTAASPGTTGLAINSSGNVGIGTTAPASLKLQVAGSALVSSTLGIGLTPTYPLDVYHISQTYMARLTSGSTIGTRLLLTNSSTGGSTWQLISTGSANSEGAGNLIWVDNAGNSRMRLLSSNGNLGIGSFSTTAPSAKLDVDGTARVRTLSATGTLMVTADANGNLGSATLPTSESTTASNGLTKTGTDVALGGTLAGATTLATGGNNLTITGTGRVGIGTATPGATLHVEGDTHMVGLLVDRNDSNTGTVFSGALRFGNTSTGEGIGSARTVGSTNRYGLDFYTGYANRLAITSAGNVGVGTAAPAVRLHVAGTSGTANVRLESLAGTGSRLVTADASGNLGTTTAINGESTTASNGLTLSGSDVKLGGTLTGATTIANDGYNLAITGAGTVGIGIAGSAYKLHVVGGDSRFAATGTQQSLFGLDRLVGFDDLRFYADDAGSNELMRLKNNGYLGLGTTTPSTTLDVNGAARVRALTATGTLMVTADANGNLGSAALPTDTDAQTLSISGGAITISGSNSTVTVPDVSATNELQTISKTGSTVTLSNSGGSFTDTDTDAQTLSVSGQTLTISGSNSSVTLPSVTGESTTASNGLTKTGTDVALGGTLTSATTIANGGNNLAVTGTGNVGIGTSSPTAKLHVDAGSVFVNGESQGLIVDSQNSKRVGLLKYSGRETGIWRTIGTGNLFEIGRVQGATALPGTPTGYLTDLAIDNAGNVGIGTDAPTAPLDVNGNVQITGTQTVSSGSIITDSEDNGFIFDENGSRRVGFLKYTGHEGGIWRTQTTGTVFEIGRVQGVTALPGTPTSYDTDFAIDDAGKVGIGTTSPQATLHVAGSTSTVRLAGLAGTGSRLVTADASGNLGTTTTITGESTTASNGLTQTGTNVALGGTLTGATTIVQAGNSFGLTGGHVGIGTASPSTRLDVTDTDSYVARVGSSNTVGTRFLLNNTSTGGGTWQMISTGSANSEGVGNFSMLSPDGTTRLRLTSSGQLGVGTFANTTPTANLDVEGTTRLRGLTGTGIRYVTTDASGNLSSTTGPTGGESTTASNGLTLNGTAVQLGGTLSQATTIANGNNALTLNGAGAVNLGTGTGTTSLGNATGATTVAGASIGLAGATTIVGATNINVSGTAATNLGTGSSAGTVTIGRNGGTVAVGNLTGTGSRVVVADANGNLSASSTLPTDAQTLSISGSTISLTNGGSVTVPSSADNLGDHTATQNLNLASYALVGNGGTQGLTIGSSGQVGLGTTTPGGVFGQFGNTSANTIGADGQGGNLTSGVGSLAWGLNATGYAGSFYNSNTSSTGNGLAVKVNGTSTSASVLDVSTGAQGNIGTSRLVVKAGGNVGINQVTPTSTLHVGGSSSTVRLEGLGNGSSTRFVTADASGNLGATTVTGESTTAGNGLTLSGTQVQLGGTLGAATTVAQAGNMFSLTGGKIGLGTASDPSGSRVSIAAGSASESALFAKLFDGTSTANSLKLEHNGSNFIVRPAAAGGITTIVENSAGHLALNPVTGGGVGIGTAAPTARLDVDGTARVRSLAATGTLMVTADASGNLGSAALPTDAQALSISGQTLSLTNGGSVTLPSVTGESTTASNGLTLTGTAVKLGGTLSAATTIAQANNNFSLTGGNVGIGTGSPAALLDVNGETATASLGIDRSNANTGTVTSASLRFGISGTGEGIGSARSTGNPNQYGLDFYTGYTNRLAIANGGNVGIGTTSPTAVLDVNGSTRLRGLTTAGVVTTDASGNLSSTNAFTSESTTAGNGLTLSGTAVQLGGTLSQATTLVNGGNTFAITGTGNVGIGTSSPGTAKLSVSGTANEVFQMQGSNTGGTWLGMSNTTTGGRHWNLISTGSGNSEGAGKLLIQDQTGAAVRATFDTNGYLGLGTTSPAVRLHVAGTSGTSNVRLESLAGTGSRMVVADASGNLGSSTLPTGESTTASNGLTLSGTAVQLGGTLSAATNVAQGGNVLSFTGGQVGIGSTNPANSNSRLHVLASSATENALYAGISGGTSTANSLKLEHFGSNFIVRPATAGGINTIVENSAGNLAFNPNGGNVGIGLTSPGVKLEVAGTAGSSNVRLQSLGGTGIRYVTAAADGTLSTTTSTGSESTTASNGLTLSGTAVQLGGTLSSSTTINQNGNSLSLTGTGNVGVGIASHAFIKLLVRSDDYSDVGYFESTHTGGTSLSLGNLSTGGRQWSLISTGSGNGEGAGKLLVRDQNGGEVRATFDTDGDLGLGTTAPAARLHVAGTAGTSNVRLESLGGTGTRVVTADASGNLSSTTLAGESTTASNGLTLSGTAVQLGGTLSAATTIANGGNDFSITGTGKVGIGTSSPGTALDVSGTTSTTALMVDATNTNTGTFANGILRFGTAASGEGLASPRTVGSTNRYGLDFYTGSNRRMAITVAGYVGVGLAAPTSTLHVEGSEAHSYTDTGSNTSLTLNGTYRTVRRATTCTTITLPTASACPGRLYTLLNPAGHGSFTLAVTGGGTVYDEITGTTFSGTNAFPDATRLTVQSDGTGWVVVGR